MPQMAPISWLILFFIFSLTFIIINILNYYMMINMNNNNMKQPNKIKNNFNLNWKW